VHNFGTFGVVFTYDLFDGGRRNAEISESRTMLSKAALNLANVEEEVTVQVEIAYDKVEQMQSLVTVAEEVLKARTEAARAAESQVEQNEALASARAGAAAKTSSAKASLLEANLGLSLAQAELKRAMGEIPRQLSAVASGLLLKHDEDKRVIGAAGDRCWSGCCLSFEYTLPNSSRHDLFSLCRMPLMW
jgi:outer membrane protein TolC